MVREYWIVECVETGHRVKTVQRESAEAVFDGLCERGRECEMYRQDEDGTVVFVKRYGGDLKRQGGERP